MTDKKRPRGQAAAKRETNHDKDDARGSFVQRRTRQSRDRAIVFSASTVAKLHAGAKTHTRRIAPLRAGGAL